MVFSKRFHHAHHTVASARFATCTRSSTISRTSTTPTNARRTKHYTTHLRHMLDCLAAWPSSVRSHNEKMVEQGPSWDSWWSSSDSRWSGWPDWHSSWIEDIFTICWLFKDFASCKLRLPCKRRRVQADAHRGPTCKRKTFSRFAQAVFRDWYCIVLTWVLPRKIPSRASCCCFRVRCRLFQIFHVHPQHAGPFGHPESPHSVWAQPHCGDRQHGACTCEPLHSGEEVHARHKNSSDKVSTAPML